MQVGCSPITRAIGRALDVSGCGAHRYSVWRGFGAPESFVGVAGSIFICFAYFIIQQVSLALGSAGHLSAWLAAWLPNMIFGTTGLVLTARCDEFEY